MQTSLRDRLRGERASGSFERWTSRGSWTTCGEQGFQPVAALVTHYHPDQIGGRMMGQTIEAARAARPEGAESYAEQARGGRDPEGHRDLGDRPPVVDSGDALRIATSRSSS